MGGDQSTSGHRIVKVKEGSPAAILNIEPMIDFLLYPPFESGSFPPFNEFITSNEGKEIELAFYNIVSQKIWRGKMIPRKWEGEGLLGLTINQEDYTTAHARVLRVLNFFVSSPLHKAGFKSHTDYILGTEYHSFSDMEDFTEFIKYNDKKSIELHVYNSETQKVRALALTPDSEWGGSGYLGGDIGFGHLHSLPLRKDQVIIVQEVKPEVNECNQEKKQEEEKHKQMPSVEKTSMVDVTEDIVEEKPIEVLGVEESDILIGESKSEQKEEINPPTEDVMI